MLAMQRSVDDAKIMAARKSLEFVEAGMVVGLGSGSTATHFIHLLGEKVQGGLKVSGIASSQASEDLARVLGIPMIDFTVSAEIDVAVDGADEVGPDLALIKGGGGALLREKIVASAAKRYCPRQGSSANSERVLPLAFLRLSSCWRMPMTRRGPDQAGL